MATREERQEYLEGLDETEWASLAQRLGDVALDKPRDKRIRWLLDAADRSGSGAGHDRAFGLLTDDEQHGQLERQAVEIAQSSARASWVSAHAAWVSVVISLVAIIISVIALVVALGERG